MLGLVVRNAGLVFRGCGFRGFGVSGFRDFGVLGFWGLGCTQG